jgi:photosystem II stability/assembly factor-like uncharacterized protein
VTQLHASHRISRRPPRPVAVTCYVVIGFFFAGLTTGCAVPAAGSPVPSTASATTTTLLNQRPSSTAPSKREKVPSLDDGAVVPPRAVLSLEMFTPQIGVALALMPPSAFGSGRYYVVRTDDGGTSWTVSGSLPRTLIPSDQLRVLMAFATPAEGYVNSYVNRKGTTHTEFTDNGGRTWSLVKVPGQATDLSIADGSLWITAIDCPGDSTESWLCPTMLATYVVGRRSPSVVSPILAEGPVLSAGSNSKTFEATLLARQGDEGLVTEGNDGLHSSILETRDAGSHWVVIPNPCHALEVSGIVELSASHWVLYCSADYGMHQGMNQLWTTTESGRSWALTAQGSAENLSQNVGNIGPDVVSDLTVSGDGSILWTFGAADGIESSANGGSIWSLSPVETDGYLSQIVTAGTTEAWLPLPGLGLYRTLDGAQWAKLS